MVDNHQEWQSQVEDKLTDLMTAQQLKEVKNNELLEAHSRESHSRNERLEDKLKRLELRSRNKGDRYSTEVLPRMTKAELNTPNKDVDRKIIPRCRAVLQSHPRCSTGRIFTPSCVVYMQ